jgi:hypothetical protein
VTYKSPSHSCGQVQLVCAYLRVAKEAQIVNLGPHCKLVLRRVKLYSHSPLPQPIHSQSTHSQLLAHPFPHSPSTVTQMQHSHILYRFCLGASVKSNSKPPGQAVSSSNLTLTFIRNSLCFRFVTKCCRAEPASISIDRHCLVKGEVQLLRVCMQVVTPFGSTSWIQC